MPTTTATEKKLDLTKKEIRIPYWKAEAAKLNGAVIEEAGMQLVDDEYMGADHWPTLAVLLTDGRFIEVQGSGDDEGNHPGHLFIDDDRIESFTDLVGGTIRNCTYVEGTFLPYLTLTLEVMLPRKRKPIYVEVWTDAEGNGPGALYLAADDIGRGILPQLS